MSQTEASTFTQRGLVQQGYISYSPEELAKLTLGLRFTPTVCMAMALVGLATQTPWIHYLLAVLGALAFVLPAHHPFDLLYNHGVRHLAGGPKLPPNPLPRRVACLLGGGMNLGIGLSFQAGALLPAYAFGAVLIALQLVVISSHFCVASWMLELGFSWRRGGTERISSQDARRLVGEGALLLDVRTPQEYGMGHLPEAVNVPIDEVAARQEELRRMGRPLVIYCSAGVRSRKAAEILRQAGLEEIHDLGLMRHW
jgi:rhodanese-related sulfurtransferase